ncbi:MAG: 2-C-methyl-D-erythritol 4-phosphate cytidylyltransferase [Tissierellia bacterium]|nr:2-C-methyl-D-erythritol 4-phosphate cytidylyltransferase [Tissierellia bacterium]
MSQAIREPFITLFVAAAGMGRRMNQAINKQFLLIQNKPILQHTLERFKDISSINHVLIIAREGEEDQVAKILAQADLPQATSIVTGGKERQDSIARGLEAMPPQTDLVLTHDGARPFVSREEVESIISASLAHGACCLMTPLKDTLKISQDGKWVDYTPNRDNLFSVQTPQGFSKSILIRAYKQAYEENYYGTDDCSLVEKTGQRVHLVKGSYNNIKITTKEDLILAEAIAKKCL